MKYKRLLNMPIVSVWTVRTTFAKIALGGLVAAACLNMTQAKADPDDDPTYGSPEQRHDALLMCQVLDASPTESTVLKFIHGMYLANLTIPQAVDTLKLGVTYCPEYATLVNGAIQDATKAGNPPAAKQPEKVETYA
jgi:hypothetical protein